MPRLAFILLLLPGPALADDCTARLAALLGSDLAANGPYIAENINVMAGAEQVYRQSFISDRHFLVETLSPPGLPATLHHEGGAWTADGAGGWTLAWQIDPDEAAAGIAAQRQAAAAAVLTATCTSGGDGTETLTGTLGPTPHLGPEASVAYVIDAGTGAVLALSYAYAINGLPVTAQYTISAAPGLTLPLPP
jgi:hypothetical protein